MLIDPELFLAFCLASAALILMPGPVVMLVVATSLRHGARTGLQAVAGASAGNAVLIACGTVGITTILALLQDLSFLVRYLGAAYLIWLGIREWRARDDGSAQEAAPPRAASILGQAFLIGVTNPKAILFYLAFFPQFLDPALPAAPQLALMAAAFMGLAVLFDAGYALAAGRVRRHMVDPVLARLRRRITGTVLIGAGLALALTRK